MWKGIPVESEQAIRTILYVILILTFGKTLGAIAERMKQSSVLGELLAGVILGGSVLAWVQPTDPILAMAELGAVLLLFEVGLESDLEEFLRVGPSAFLVAAIGLTGPFVVGYGASVGLGLSTTASVFMGATLTATSVGITARTLSDLRQLDRTESHIILGAAVIDDVLGLVLLAVVSGLAMHGSVSAAQIIKTSVLAVVFLVGAILIGVPIAPHALNLIRRIPARGALMVASFLFCLVMSYVAHLIGLASIVGAFAAGLVLARTDDQAYLSDRVAPLADVFVPLFFVVLGISVNLKVFSPSAPDASKVLLLTAVLAAVAIVMKLFSGLGVLKRGVNRWVVGVGMIPRGEVGLIFASVGLARAIITPLEYSAVVAVVAITTLATPGLLKLVLGRAGMLSEKVEHL